jgi:hypothetical protein
MNVTYTLNKLLLIILLKVLCFIVSSSLILTKVQCDQKPPTSKQRPPLG